MLGAVVAGESTVDSMHAGYCNNNMPIGCAWACHCPVGVLCEALAAPGWCTKPNTKSSHTWTRAAAGAVVASCRVACLRTASCSVHCLHMLQQQGGVSASLIHSCVLFPCCHTQVSHSKHVTQFTVKLRITGNFSSHRVLRRHWGDCCPSHWQLFRARSLQVGLTKHGNSYCIS